MVDFSRLFIAVSISEEVLDEAFNIALRIRRRLDYSSARISWVKKDNLHFTLKFIGETLSENIGTIVEALHEISASHQPFKIRIQDAGCFPNSTSPRVLWLGLTEGADEMKKLAADVENMMNLLEFTEEKRPFSPHLTIARIKAPGNTDFSKELEPLRGIGTDTCIIDHMTLFKSTLNPSGAVHYEIERIMLGKDPLTANR